jgi:hypothetical protein
MTTELRDTLFELVIKLSHFIMYQNAPFFGGASILLLPVELAYLTKDLSEIIIVNIILHQLLRRNTAAIVTNE